MPEVENSDSENIASPMLKINIFEQIEYYFGDFNLMKDKYLRNEMSKNNGWVHVNTLLRFNRLAALSKDIDVILSAFDDTPSSIVEVNKGTKCIRRHPDRPIPEANQNWKNSVAERTVYIKGFPTESTTLDDILKFMQTFGKIDNVYKRSYWDKALQAWKFKGSVFVNFPTKEDAENFLSIKSVKYSGTELIRKWQNDYMEDKKNERIQQKLKNKELKHKLIEEQQHNGMKAKKLPTGALIHLSGLIDQINLLELKKAVEALDWNVSFVDYKPGDTEAYVRLQKQDSAKEAVEKLDNGSFKINDVSIEAKILEGDKETEILEKMEKEKYSKMMDILIRKKEKHGKGKKKMKHFQNLKKKSGSENYKGNDVMDTSGEKQNANSVTDGISRENSDFDIDNAGEKQNANSITEEISHDNSDTTGGSSSVSCKRKPEEDDSKKLPKRSKSNED